MMSPYDDHLKWLMIEASALMKAEAKGKEEGRAEGRAEGELNKAKQIAQAMLKRGIDISVIQEVAGRSIDEIKSWNPLGFKGYW
jgi:predicted transposase/invertase (TIGR01784 family)